MALPQIRLFFSLLVCLLSLAKTGSNVTSAGSATESTKFFWRETLKSGTKSGTVTTLTTTSSMMPMTRKANDVPWDNILEGNVTFHLKYLWIICEIWKVSNAYHKTLIVIQILGRSECWIMHRWSLCRNHFIFMQKHSLYFDAP